MAKVFKMFFNQVDLLDEFTLEVAAVAKEEEEEEEEQQFFSFFFLLRPITSKHNFKKELTFF